MYDAPVDLALVAAAAPQAGLLKLPRARPMTMITKAVLDLMQCAACAHPELGIGTRREPELVCQGCGERYPFVDGIVDMVPRSAVHKYRYYRTDTLLNLIAPLYDLASPIVSLLIWKCPPLRYVDMAHRAVGRSIGGAYVECPIGTGLVLGHIRAEHVAGPLIGIDSSWKMLQKARKRFEALGMLDRVTLMRGDPEHLPIRSGAIRSLQSVNGLHTFHERKLVLKEFDRLMEPGGFISGSALIRGHGAVADMILNQYERYGVFPMLRSRAFILTELREMLAYPRLQHETYGAVLFFSTHKPDSTPQTPG